MEELLALVKRLEHELNMLHCLGGDIETLQLRKVLDTTIEALVLTVEQIKVLSNRKVNTK